MSGQTQAKFLTGDPLRHVTVMALSASAGLLSMFIVDFVDLYFISLLGDPALTAAVGFAGSLLFFNMAIGIGLMIATSALAARRVGQGDGDGARAIATNVLVLGAVIGVVVGALFALFAADLMALIGAEGDARARGAAYLRIVTLSMPIMVVGMVASGLLRAHGDARRAMNATLSAGVVNAILDPILIFGVGLGLEGAAFASVGARIAMAATAMTPVLRHYGGFAPFVPGRFLGDFARIMGIAGPAILTNVATPVGALITMRYIASFGEDVVAGYAVISRLTPLAFCVLFALSGAVGPIIGQNFGAGDYGRVRETLRKALIFAAVYTLLIWSVLAVSTDLIAEQFRLTPEGAELVTVFGLAVAPLFYFNGVLFIANAAFNNLNRPTWSTVLNWGRNTLGIFPFVWLGSGIAGATGVLIGQALGGVIFALVAASLAFRLARGYHEGSVATVDRDKPYFGGTEGKPAE